MVRWLDAGSGRLDERALRAWGREQTAAAPGPYSSRAYRHPYALVAWHGAPVGVDIERVEHFDDRFLDSICTPSERALVGQTSFDDAAVASLWCSKEALTKALGDALRYDPRRIGSPLFWPGGRSGPWRALPLPAPTGHTAWLCWCAPE